VQRLHRVDVMRWRFTAADSPGNEPAEPEVNGAPSAAVSIQSLGASHQSALPSSGSSFFLLLLLPLLQRRTSW
jgi:hypothetical protein